MTSTKIYFDVVKLDAVTSAPFSVSPMLVECIRPVTQKQVVELLRQQTIVPPRSPIFMLREEEVSGVWVELEKEPASMLDVDELRARVVLLEGEDALAAMGWSICTWDACMAMRVTIRDRVLRVLRADVWQPLLTVWRTVMPRPVVSRPPPDRPQEHTTLMVSSPKPHPFSLSNASRRAHK